MYSYEDVKNRLSLTGLNPAKTDQCSSEDDKEPWQLCENEEELAAYQAWGCRKIKEFNAAKRRALDACELRDSSNVPPHEVESLNAEINAFMAKYPAGANPFSVRAFRMRKRRVAMKKNRAKHGSGVESQMAVGDEEVQKTAGSVQKKKSREFFGLEGSIWAPSRFQSK